MPLVLKWIEALAMSQLSTDLDKYERERVTVIVCKWFFQPGGRGKF
jgi:hypothetical protein